MSFPQILDPHGSDPRKIKRNFEILRFWMGKAHSHNTDRTPTESADGSRTGFSTTEYFLSGTLDVFQNGQLLTKDADYTEDADRKGYNFTYSPEAGSVIQHRYLVDHP